MGGGAPTAAELARRHRAAGLPLNAVMLAGRPLAVEPVTTLPLNRLYFLR